MNRRQTILAAGVGGAAAVAGGSLAWWRASRPDDTAGFWTMGFETPSGARLDTAPLRGRPLLLNFWASWCAPCVREMPTLDAFARERAGAGWQVLGLAIDNLENVRKFLAEVPVGFPIALGGPQALTLARGLGNAQGGLPYSVAFDRRGRPVRRHAGELTAVDLRAWADAIG